MPVTMPGSAIGMMSNVVKAFLPKKRSRFSAAAVSVPNTMAISVATVATESDNTMASRMSVRSIALLTQRRVSPLIGKL